MEKQINYKGYEIIATINKKIKAIIKDNIFISEIKQEFGKNLLYEPPMQFVFSNYETMIKFIDENPR